MTPHGGEKRVCAYTQRLNVASGLPGPAVLIMLLYGYLSKRFLFLSLSLHLHLHLHLLLAGVSVLLMGLFDAGPLLADGFILPGMIAAISYPSLSILVFFQMRGFLATEGVNSRGSVK